MDAFSAMMDMRMSGGSMKTIAASDLEKGFSPISDLKPGDKLRWKGKNYKSCSAPELDQIIIVNTAHDNYNMPQRDGGNNDMLDFSAIFVNTDGEIVEFLFDSRRFERVE